jgi:phosphoribosylformylglycinamidine cyclo-ligase
MTDLSDAYKQAGVDLHLVDTLKSGLKHKVRKTKRPEVLGDIGGFGGLFQLDLKKFKQPVLVSSVDGIGTKLKIAAALGKHDTLGFDLVNHCVNDVAVHGAEPLFFLDYIAMSKLRRETFEQLIDGIARACADAGCALIGGETAQMPDMYRAGEFDLVGCIVGCVEKSKLIDGSRVRAGDALVGFASSGLHTNGYSLARQILFAQLRVRLDDFSGELGCTFGEELMKTHRNYWPLVRKLQQRRANSVHALAHITGGGLVGNLPRVLPAQFSAKIFSNSWPVPPIFRLLQREGNISDAEMRQVFNLGVGLVAVVDKNFADAAQKIARSVKIPAFLIGEIVKKRGRHVEFS